MSVKLACRNVATEVSASDLTGSAARIRTSVEDYFGTGR